MKGLNLIVSFKSNRFNTGLLIGSISLTTCLFFHFSVFAGILLFSIFTSVGIFKLIVPPKYNKYIGGFILLCSATINVVLMQLIMNESLLSIGVTKIILNIISVLLVLLSIFVVVSNVQLTCCAGTFLFLLFAIVNNCVNSYRGVELTVLDLVSIRTAINVIESYTFELTPTTAYGVLLGIWTIFTFYACPTIIFRGIKTRVLTLASIVITTWILLIGSSEFHAAQAQYIRGGSELNGCFLNFVLSGKEAVFTKPTNYDLRTIADLEKEYASVSLSESKKPTIIVIMDESFADLSVLGSKINTNMSVTPFLDSMYENTIKGYALTSIFGGNTPNSEFEFLTGNSMAFLPKSAIPYQQYISQEKSSILSDLKEYDYTCEVTHPFDSTGWMRPKVYSLLQFDQVTFIEDYPQKNLLRDFVSDQEMFEYIVQKYEERNPKNGFFLFGVTMQNHGGYAYKGDNYKDSVFLSGYSKEYFDVMVCNPPYFKYNSDKVINEKLELTIARHEIKISLSDIFSLAKSYLKNKGSLYIVHRAERFDEIAFLAYNSKLYIKKVQFVSTKKGDKPQMVLVQCIKNSKPGIKINCEICVDGVKSYQNIFKEEK